MNAAIVHERTYVGLGSNLANPLNQLRCAIDALAKLPNTRLLSQSSLYSSPAEGPAGQPDYMNAVAELETCLSPADLLEALQGIEDAQGRRRGLRWGARTLDLDLLLWGTQLQSSAKLSLPHPEMHRRAFVLVPLREVAPALEIPGHGLITKLLDAVSRVGLRVVALP